MSNIHLHYLLFLIFLIITLIPGCRGFPIGLGGGDGGQDIDPELVSDAMPWCVDDGFDRPDQVGWLWTGEIRPTDSSNSVLTDEEGNVYVGGTFQGKIDFNPGPGLDELESSGGPSTYITKFGPLGEYFWTSGWGISHFGIEDMVMDQNEDIYAVGNFSTFGATGAGVKVRKIDSNGEFLWEVKTGGSPDRNDSPSVAVGNDGNVYVGNGFRFLVDFDPGPELDEQGRRGEYDQGFLTSYTTDGEYRWTRSWIFRSRNPVRDIGTDSEGNIIVIGIFSDTVDFDPGDEYSELTARYSGQSFVMKIDSGGELVWAQPLDPEERHNGNEIYVDLDDNIFIFGEIYGQTNQLFLKGFNSDGEPILNKIFEGGGHPRGRRIDQDNEGNFILAGVFKEGFEPFPLESGFQWNYYVMKLDSNLGIAWVRHWGYSVSERWNILPELGLATDYYGNVFVCGEFKGFVDFDSSEEEVCRFGGNQVLDRVTSDGFILKLSVNGNFYEEGANIGAVTWVEYPYSEPVAPNYTHRLLGIWDTRFDIASLSIDLTEDTGAFDRLNIPETDIPPADSEFLRFQITGYDPHTRELSCVITIENPYPETRAYSTRVIFVDPEENLDLVSPDGFTKLWAEIDEELELAFGYLGIPEPSSNDPYPIVYAGETYTRECTFLIAEGVDDLSFKLVADISAPGPPMEPALITDIGFERYWTQDGMESLTVSSRVFDAQGDEKDVRIIQHPFNNHLGQATSSPTLHQWYIYNDADRPPGDYEILIMATSEDAPELPVYQLAEFTLLGTGPPQPTACFQFYLNTQNWTPGHPIAFNARCSGPYMAKYFWDFDNGDTLETSETWIEYAFDEEGTYDVSLVVQTGDVLSEPFSIPVELRSQVQVAELTPGMWNYFPKDIEVDRSTVYMAAGSGGLVIIDVSNPSWPQISANLELPGEAVDVALSDGYAYLACGSGGLQVVDISDPSEPTLAGEFPIRGLEAWCVEVFDDIAYLGICEPYFPDWEFTEEDILSQMFGGDPPSDLQAIGLIGIDVSDPSSLEVVFEYETEERGIANMDIDGEYLYCLEDFGDNLVIVKLTGPDAPSVAGRTAIESSPGMAPQFMLVNNSTVYIAAPFGGVNSMSVDESGNVSNETNLPFPWSEIMAVSGDYLFISGAGSGLGVLDISDPDSVYQVAQIDARGTVAMEIIDDYYLFTARSGGFEVFQIRPIFELGDEVDEDEITSIYQYPEGAPGSGVPPGVAGLPPFAPLGPDMNVLPGAAPIVHEPITASGGITTFASPARTLVYGNYLYVLDPSIGWHIIDITDPESAEIIGNVDLPGSLIAIIVGTYAYSGGMPGLNIISLAEPAEPELTGSLSINSSLTALAYKNSLVYGVNYMSSSGGLHIIDVDDPQNPFEIFNLEIEDNCNDIVVIDGYAYIANNERGLTIVDVDPPREAHVTGSLDIRDRCRSVTYYDGYLLISGLYRTLAIAEIKSPGVLEKVNEFVTRHRTRNLFIENGYAYSGTDGEHFIILDVYPPAETHQLGVIDVPFKVTGITVQEGYGFTTSREDGFHIIEIPWQ